MAVPTKASRQQSDGPVSSSVCQAAGLFPKPVIPFSNLHSPYLDCLLGKLMDPFGIKTRRSWDNRLKCLKASHPKANQSVQMPKTPISMLISGAEADCHEDLD
jgi:hypothetical protein